MANLRGSGAFSQRNLIASYSDKQITTQDGQAKGAFVTIELDQSTMTQKDAKAGKADTNPYIESHKTQGPNGDYTSHNVWYSKSQIDAMESAGKSVKQEDGRNAIAFKGDIQKSGDKLIVLTPKDLDKAKDDTERAKMEKYNEAHKLNESDNKAFNSKSLAKQEKITALAKENRPSRESSKTAELQQVAETEAQADEPEVG